VLAGERVDPLRYDHPEVLDAHLVDALVDGWDELDERDGRAIEDLERGRKQDLRGRPAVPDVSRFAVAWRSSMVRRWTYWSHSGTRTATWLSGYGRMSIALASRRSRCCAANAR
jgi:hypothetical protein